MSSFYIISYHYTTGSSLPWCVIVLWRVWPPCSLHSFHLASSNRLGLSFRLDFIFPIECHIFFCALKNHESIIFLPHCFIASFYFHRVLTKHINHFEGVPHCAWHSLASLSGSFILPHGPKPRLECLFSADQELANSSLWTKYGPSPFLSFPFFF